MTHSLKESQFDEDERVFLGLGLSREVFGALYAALQYRKESLGLSRADFGERTGRDKTGVSKLLRGPGNWTIQTIADVANALELDIEFAFFDRYDQTRIFTATGMHRAALPTQNYSITGQHNAGSFNLLSGGGIYSTIGTITNFAITPFMTNSPVTMLGLSGTSMTLGVSSGSVVSVPGSIVPHPAITPYAIGSGSSG
jgi:transcriptional regulator with XRE-family HTH domain